MNPSVPLITNVPGAYCGYPKERSDSIDPTPPANAPTYGPIKRAVV